MHPPHTPPPACTRLLLESASARISLLRFISDLAQLPPSMSEIAKKIERSNYRLAHWMRALLPIIDLSDVPLSGFMPLPGSGCSLLPDGSNVAFDWGAPEQLAQHLPKEVTALRKKRPANASTGLRCRAIVGPPKQRHRCTKAVHALAGVEEGWLVGTCGTHKHRGMFELLRGECWSAEAEAVEEAAAAAAAAAAATVAGGDGGGPADQDNNDGGAEEVDAAAALAALTAAGFRLDEDDEDEEATEAEEQE